MFRLTEIFDKKIYAGSKYVGVARDVILDADEGKAESILKTDAYSLLGRDIIEAKKKMRENAIPFNKVMAVKDIILLRP